MAARGSERPNSWHHRGDPGRNDWSTKDCSCSRSRHLMAAAPLGRCRRHQSPRRSSECNTRCRSTMPSPEACGERFAAPAPGRGLARELRLSAVPDLCSVIAQSAAPGRPPLPTFWRRSYAPSVMHVGLGPATCSPGWPAFRRLRRSTALSSASQPVFRRQITGSRSSSAPRRLSSLVRPIPLYSAHLAIPL